MLALSTAWQSSVSEGGQEVLEKIRKLGVEAVELEYRITPKMFSEMLPAIKANQISIVSIHNFFPVPPEEQGGSGDVFLFSAEDEDERAFAIKYTTKALELASDLEVRVLVLHLGKSEMSSQTEKLRDLYNRGAINSAEGKAFLAEISQMRREKGRRSLDRVLLCLDKLNYEAEKKDIYLGIENRYHFHEIPDYDDLSLIFKEFSGSNLRYWHDTGHAAVQEKLGLTSQEKLLSSFKEQLVGVHFHDTKGCEDHFAPGTGEIDFAAIKEILPKDEFLKVVEVHPKVKEEEVIASFQFLEKLGVL